MPETIDCSPATSIALVGNSAGSAPTRTAGAKPLKFKRDFDFRRGVAESPDPAKFRAVC